MVIERKLWDDMRHTATTFSMPMASHQQLQSLFSQIEQIANQAQQPAPEVIRPNGEMRVDN
jgi:hypothetical protein